MPQRRPIAEVDVDRTPNTELSRDTVNRLLGRHLAGQSGDQIARAGQLPKRTVNKVLPQ